jgi:hypothetical protein
MNCIICGKEIEKSKYSNATLCSDVCFEVNFWNGFIPIKGWSNIVRIDGEHYVIESDNPNSYFKGFGGRKFIIEFFDGRKITTHNLWHQGTIPESHKAILPNNAKFVKE